MGALGQATSAATLADLLGGPGVAGDGVGPEALGEARAHLEAAARAATAVGGWTGADPLRLSKAMVTWLVRCPRRAVTPDGHGDADDLALGLVVDAAAKVATLSARRPVTADRALAFLTALGETAPADRLGAPGADAARLREEAAARVDRLMAAWPPTIDPGWWPRVEEPVRVALAGGAVTVTGRLDILLGGLPTGRPALVVEVKGGRWYDGMRADAHLYALLVGLRDGLAPSAVVTLVADGTTQLEPIRPAVIHHAGERLELALWAAAGLATGEAPEARPGNHCGHCPVRPECLPGQRWLADAATAAARGTDRR